MENIALLTDARKPIVAFCAQILAAIASDPDVIAAVRAMLAPATPAPSEPAGLLAAADLARALGVSKATIGRLDREGMPSERVGTRRRYNLDTCRAWLATRGRKRTVATPSDRVDVASVLDRAGLRVVGGSR